MPTKKFVNSTNITQLVQEKIIPLEQNKQDKTDSVGQKIVNGGEIFNSYTSDDHTINIASGAKSHAEGSSTTAAGARSHTEGTLTQALGANSHAEGYGSKSIGDNGHSEGGNGIFSNNTVTLSGNANSKIYTCTEDLSAIHELVHPEYANILLSYTDPDEIVHHYGVKSINENQIELDYTLDKDNDLNSVTAQIMLVSAAIGFGSHSEGSSLAIGGYSHSESFGQAFGSGSHAEGNNTRAEGNYSHVEGTENLAKGNYSHAEGWRTQALGNGSHAEGAIVKLYENCLLSGDINTTTYTVTGTLCPANNVWVIDNNNQWNRVSIVNYSYSGATITTRESLNPDEVWAEHPCTIYALPTAQGIGSHAENSGFAYSDNSHAEGFRTSTVAANSHAEGAYTKATNTQAHAEGNSSTASGTSSHAENFSTASGGYSHSEGYSTVARGANSHAEGKETSAANENSHAEGYKTTAAGDCGHAEGYQTTVSASYGHAEGNETKATGTQSHAEGLRSIAEGNASHAEGTTVTTSITISGEANATTYTVSANPGYWLNAGNTDANNIYIVYNNTYYKPTAWDISNKKVTFANTLSTTALTNAAVKWAFIPYTSAGGAHAEGAASARGTCSHAEAQGYASAWGAHAEGNYTCATGNYSHAEGNGSYTNVTGGHVEGYRTKVTTNNYGHSEGYSTVATGGWGAHAEGRETSATNENSHAEGYKTTASGQAAHAEGDSTTASGSYSHAEGSGTTASLSYAHAEGYHTIASGLGAHAEGNSSQAIGNNSHVEGEYCFANHSNTHVEGSFNQSSASNQHIFGKYNDYENAINCCEIVGNGSNGIERANIRTLDWNGNERLKGGITLGGPFQIGNTIITEQDFIDLFDLENGEY